MNISDNIGTLLQHLAFSLTRQNDQILQERLGLGFSQFKILMVLERNPYIQQKDIAETLGQTEASISRQIKLMVERGMLQTSVSPQNRRRHITTLTIKGMRLYEESVKVLNAHSEQTLGRLSEREQQQLLATLNIMHDSACTHIS